MAKRRVRSKRSRARSRRRWRLALQILGGTVFVLVIFLLLFQVRHVEVTGNTRYTDEEVRDMALDTPLSFNTLLLAAIQPKTDLSDIPFMESIEFVYVSKDTIRIEVTEKRTIGYLEEEGERLYFDKDGVVLEVIPIAAAQEPLAAENLDSSGGEQNPESSETPAPEETDGASQGDALTADTVQSARVSVSEFRPSLDNVPLIRGLAITPAAEGERLGCDEPSVFSTILALTRMIEKYDIAPDYVEFGEGMEITLSYYGTVRAALGHDDFLEEKMTRLAAILPDLSGRSGVLHLEDYTEASESFVFTEDVPEENPEGGEE